MPPLQTDAPVGRVQSRPVVPGSAEDLAGRNELVVEENRGEFFKPCPGTAQGYNCCGYQILTPLTGCGMYCRFCILQVYFDDHRQVLYTNWADLEREVEAKMAAHQGRIVRVGTGEFADSLYLEPRLGLSTRVAALFERYPNAVVEFKTKSANIASLGAIRNPRQVVIGFSMNTPEMIGLLEKGTASLQQRLQAARTCEEMGFWLAFHFDPMVWHPSWKTAYRSVIESIFSSVKAPGRIAWWSCGGFRSVPALKAHLKASGEHLPLFGGEMVLGEDRKLRYFRPLRVEFYRLMAEEIGRHCPAVPLYLCMESPEVWRESGLQARIPQGLKKYLDQRAAQMLGLDRRMESATAQP
jgi:spore photoproduct lyase